MPAVAAALASGWLLLAPYHEGPYAEPDAAGTVRQYTQVFQKPQAEKMVAAFKVRRDGLYVKAAWNDLGQQNLAQGYLLYPSPAWLYDQREAANSGRIVPEELVSVGMTNSPRIRDAAVWANCAPGSGARAPGFSATARNSHLAEGTLPPMLAATSPADTGEEAGADADDLATPEGRRRAFSRRVNELQKPPASGGPGRTLAAAVAEMRANPGDAALLKAMGA